MYLETKFAKDIHCKEYQRKLVEIKTSPGRDFLVQKLLGLPLDEINSIYNKRKGPTPDLSKVNIKPRRFNHHDNRDALDDSFDIHSVSKDCLESLRDHHTSNIQYKHNKFDAKWVESQNQSIHNQETYTQRIFELDNSPELETTIRRLLGLDNDTDKDFISLLFFFPFSKNDTLPGNEFIQFGWDIFEGILERNSPTDAVALLSAIQLLELGKNSNTACLELIQRTVINDFFQTKPLQPEYDENNELIDYKNNSVFKKEFGVGDFFPDASRESKNEESRILRASIEKRPLSFRRKVVVSDRRSKTGPTKQVNNLEIINSGLCTILPQTPGILCKLKIPTITLGKVSQKSNIWLFGPKYLIEFLEYSNAGLLASEEEMEEIEKMDKDDKEKALNRERKKLEMGSYERNGTTFLEEKNGKLKHIFMYTRSY